MKVNIVSAVVLLATSTEAIQHYKFAEFHGQYEKAHDELVALEDPFLYSPPVDPAPEIPGGESDDRYKSLWRNKWPQGIDNAANDEDVLNMKGLGRKYKKPSPELKYEYKLDSDIIDSQKHTDDVEELLEKKFEKKDFRDRAYNILNYGSKAIKSWYL